MRRRPTPANFNLSEILDSLAPLKPSTSAPSGHSLPKFHNDFYVRMLAAKPKMDAVTRRVYPSTLLTKIGLNPKKEIGVMSPVESFNGPRVWVSSSPAVSRVPKEVRGKLALKHPWAAQLRDETDYSPKNVLLKDLKSCIARCNESQAETDLPVIYKIAFRENEEHTSSDTTPTFNIAKYPELLKLGLPDSIRSSTSGLHLAGFLFKYLYLYGELRGKAILSKL